MLQVSKNLFLKSLSSQVPKKIDCRKPSFKTTNHLFLWEKSCNFCRVVKIPTVSCRLRASGLSLPLLLVNILILNKCENEHCKADKRTKQRKHCKNWECCPRHSLFKGHNVIVNIVVLNCQICNQCLKCHVSGHKNFQKLWKLPKKSENFQKLSKLSKIVKNCQNCQKVSKL